MLDKALHMHHPSKADKCDKLSELPHYLPQHAEISPHLTRANHDDDSLTGPATVHPRDPSQRRPPTRGPAAILGVVRVGVRREQVGTGLGKTEPAGVAQALCGAASNRENVAFFKAIDRGESVGVGLSSGVGERKPGPKHDSFVLTCHRTSEYCDGS